MARSKQIKIEWTDVLIRWSDDGRTALGFVARFSAVMPDGIRKIGMIAFSYNTGGVFADFSSGAAMHPGLGDLEAHAAALPAFEGAIEAMGQSVFYRGAVARLASDLRIPYSSDLVAAIKDWDDAMQPRSLAAVA